MCFSTQVAHKFAHKLWTPEHAWWGPACSVHVLPFLSSCLSGTHALSIVTLSLKFFKGARFFPASEFSYRYFLNPVNYFTPPHSLPTLLFPCWLPLHLNSKWNVSPLDLPKWNVISVLFWTLLFHRFIALVILCNDIFTCTFIYLMTTPSISLEATCGIRRRCIFLHYCVLSIQLNT